MYATSAPIHSNECPNHNTGLESRQSYEPNDEGFMPVQATKSYLFI